MRCILGRRLAESEPVVIVGSSVSLLRTRSVPRLSQRRKPLPGAGMGYHYYPRHFPTGVPGLGSVARALNRHLLRREVDGLCPPSATRIACYDSPSQCDLVGRLGESLSIYLAVDDRTMTVSGELIDGDLENEKRLLAKVDRVICVSTHLAETLKVRLPRDRRIPILVLHNGYDDRRFDPRREWEEPSILRGVPHPRVLVSGHISERIDWDGIAAAAGARPQWTWVFAGNADPGLVEKIAALSDGIGSRAGELHAPRLCYRGAVPADAVPSLIAHSDACAVPYRLNPFTLASSPLKGVEYLAMGAPVLSTRIPSLARYGKLIQWVDQGDGQSYARGLDVLGGMARDRASVAARASAVTGESWSALLPQFKRMLFNEQAPRLVSLARSPEEI